MHRLRHPIRSVTEPFGKAGLTVAILALVFAMAGGAWAAAGLNGKQKKEVTKIAKKYAGKPGAAGPQGNPGPAGAPGKDGTNGSNGSNGTNGANGESVTVNAYEGEECEESPEEKGAEFSNGTGTAYACNGTEGSPWTAGGTLPVGSTETGSYSFTIVGFGGSTTEGNGVGAISFAIPLAGEPDAAHTIINPTSGAANANCENAAHTGTASVSNPEAKSGFLCVFPVATNGGALPTSISKSSSPGGPPGLGASKSGALLKVFTEGELGEPAVGVSNWGTFAVTG